MALEAPQITTQQRPGHQQQARQARMAVVSSEHVCVCVGVLAVGMIVFHHDGTVSCHGTLPACLPAPNHPPTLPHSAIRSYTKPYGADCVRPGLTLGSRRYSSDETRATHHHHQPHHTTAMDCIRYQEPTVGNTPQPRTPNATRHGLDYRG